MKRNIVKIDPEKCNGCGLCVNACHEGALQLVNGKAVLVSESYCDGLGACLPECPTGAITIEEREAAAFDEEAVKKNMQNLHKNTAQTNNNEHAPSSFTCPGTRLAKLNKNRADNTNKTASAEQLEHSSLNKAQSELNQWPCQIKLVPANAPYFENADILIAADCTAFAYANIHKDFMKGKITLIGCPKLDNVDYSQKLEDILRLNNINSITVLRMEVPCCGGIVHAVKNAMLNSGKMVPWSVVTISIDGSII